MSDILMNWINLKWHFSDVLWIDLPRMEPFSVFLLLLVVVYVSLFHFWWEVRTWLDSLFDWGPTWPSGLRPNGAGNDAKPESNRNMFSVYVYVHPVGGRCKHNLPWQECLFAWFTFYWSYDLCLHTFSISFGALST